MNGLAKLDVTTTQNSDLVKLANLITSSVEEILRSCGTQKFPPANEPFSLESESVRMNPDIQTHNAVLVAAASQLIAAVRPPPLALLIHGLSYYVPVGIRIVIELHVAEILRDAGPQGMHVKDIAAPTHTDADKLARVLRLLATNHIFREIAPDTFAHNRVSSLLDTGKTVHEILMDPESKYDKTIAVSALLEHFTDEGMKGSIHLPSVLTDPKLAHSSEPTETAFNMAFDVNLPLFDWLELPENSYRRRRFGQAMEGGRNLMPPDSAIKGFDWKALPADSVVVDVGGGFGTQILSLARAFSHLKFIVQDQTNVISDALKYWETQFPEAIISGQVQLQAHDFFNAQPVQAPAVFYLRMILHDWSDEYCLKILRRLRAAAGPDTRLIVSDKIVSYACEEPQGIKDLLGATSAQTTAPAPLLENYGAAGTLIYLSDLNMMSTLNGAERTLTSFKALYEQSGWLLVGAEEYGLFSTADPKIIGVPA